MNRTERRIPVYGALLFMFVIICASVGLKTSAQNGGCNNCGGGPTPTPSPANTFDSHHTELTIVANPADSPTFPLLRLDWPVQINISSSVLVEQFPGSLPCIAPGEPPTITVTSGPLLEAAIVVGSASGGSAIENSLGAGLQSQGFWVAGIRMAPNGTDAIIAVQNGHECGLATPQYVISGPITYHISMWY